MSRIYTAILALVVAFVGFSATAMAAGEVTPTDGSLLDYAKPVYEAVMHGQWWLAASLALVLSVAMFRKYAPGKAREWAHTDVGGAVLVLLMSFGGAVATALAAGGVGAAMSVSLAWMAFKVALGAAGGYSLAKKLLVPLLRKLAAVAPSWAKPVFSMILWVFDKPTTTEQAEAAGEAAVVANPGTGASGPAGTPTDI